MTLPQIHSDYLERYDESEGKQNFFTDVWFCVQTGVFELSEVNSFLESVIYSLPFPDCLGYCEMKREINERNTPAKAK